MTAGGATAHDVCALDELEPGVPRELLAGARRVGVVRVGERVHAFGAACPHHGGPLVRGRVRPFLASACAGNLTVDRERPVVTCPWHNWEFDLSTGAALADRRRRMLVYAVEVRDGRVVVHV